jgi:hypothetical protein
MSLKKSDFVGKQNAELNKAISIGNPALVNSGLVGYQGMVSVNMDNTLKSVTYEQKDLTFYPSLSVSSVNSGVFQYSKILARGNSDAIYSVEGGVGVESQSDYVTETGNTVIFAEKRAVTDRARDTQLANGMDILTEEIKNGTLELLRKIEQELFSGNAWFLEKGELTGSKSVLPSSLRNITMRGLHQQIVEGSSDPQQQLSFLQGYGVDLPVVSSAEGSILTETDIENASKSIFENGGNPKELHAAPGVFTAYNIQFQGNTRYAPSLGFGNSGISLNSANTSCGEVKFRPNRFIIRNRKSPQTNSKLNKNVPGAIGTVTAASVASGVSTTFEAADVYKYIVKGVNINGEGLVSAEVSIAVTAANHQIELSIPALSTASYFQVYRTQANGASGSEAFIGNVANEGSVTKFIDRNRVIPLTETAYFINTDSSDMEIKQFKGLTKTELAKIDLSTHINLHMEISYCLYAARRQYMLVNVGI